MPFDLPQREPCPFCENIAGRAVVSSREPGTLIECAAIETCEDSFAFVNTRQLEVPHVLVIPRRHAPTVVDLTSTEAAAIMRQVHRIAHAVVAAFDPPGLNIYQNNGIAAGQSVGHFHFHVLARYSGDLDLPRSTQGLPLTPLAERRVLAERIRSHLSP